MVCRVRLPWLPGSADTLELVQRCSGGAAFSCGAARLTAIARSLAASGANAFITYYRPRGGQ